MWWQNIELWKLITPALSAIAGLLLAAGLSALAFARQLRRTSVMQVYLDAVPALYEAERLVAQKLLGHVNKEGLSAAEHEETSKAFMSLLGRIGKLYLVARPETIDAIGNFSDALLRIHAGLVPVSAERDHIIVPMKATDIEAQVIRFHQARVCESDQFDAGEGVESSSSASSNSRAASRSASSAAVE